VAEPVPLRVCIPAMDEAALDKVRRVERLALARPQVPIPTQHVLHGGLYARTVFVPAGVMITGVLVKIATLLVVQGEATVFVGGLPLELSGYTVLPASAGRKQAFVARSDLFLTMVFPTDAQTVEEAERAFTDEAGALASRRERACNHVLITGE
jgi:hypothetical protein